MFYLRVGAALTGFFAASIYAFLLTLVARDKSRVPRAYGRALRRTMHPFLGLQVEVEGRENLDRARPCIFVVNHQSAFDVPVLAEIFPEDTVLIAKSELRKLPLFGWIYEATGNIFINRSDTKGSVARLREAEEAIANRGVSIWIFPEGTRGRVPGKLLPFKKGAFHLAIAAQVPVVPIVVSPIKEIFDSGRRSIRSGTATIRVLPPIHSAGMEERDVQALIRAVHDSMSHALKELVGRSHRALPSTSPTTA